MATSVHYKRGTSEQLANTPLQDGTLAFTVDDGRIHMDYVNTNNELIRRTFYSGVLTFGSHQYDGTTDVNVTVYEGEIQ